MKAWSIRHLQEKLQQDLLLCNSDFERSMVKAIGGKEIRETAYKYAAERKLTPCEFAIASQYGYR